MGLGNRPDVFIVPMGLGNEPHVCIVQFAAQEPYIQYKWLSTKYLESRDVMIQN